MKANILLLFALTAQSIYAGAFGGSSLHLSSYDPTPITVMMGGQTFPSYTNSIDMKGINPGTHQLKVMKTYFHWGSQFPSYVPIYDGFITINPGAKVFATVSGFNDLLITKVIYNYAMGNSYFNNYNNGCGTGYNLPNPYFNAPMNTASFSSLKNTISNQWFESSMEEIMMQAIASNYFTSTQVSELLSLLTFESTKVDIAKAAYSKVVDQNNFFVIYNQFDFSSSISELQKYVVSR